MTAFVDELYTANCYECGYQQEFEWFSDAKDAAARHTCPADIP